MVMGGRCGTGRSEGGIHVTGTTRVLHLVACEHGPPAVEAAVAPLSDDSQALGARVEVGAAMAVQGAAAPASHETATVEAHGDALAATYAASIMAQESQRAIDVILTNKAAQLAVLPLANYTAAIGFDERPTAVRHVVGPLNAEDTCADAASRIVIIAATPTAAIFIAPILGHDERSETTARTTDEATLVARVL